MYVRPAAAAAAAFLGFTLTVLGGTASCAASGPAPGPRAAPGPVGFSTPVVYAHRGASAYAPENTLEAIDLAMRLGFDWVENDVQRTRDGVLVVVHDDTLNRTTDVEQRYPNRKPWKVKDFTAEEIAGLDAGSWFSEEFAGARIPTLREYLARVQRNQQRLLLEIKKPELYPGIERETLKVLDETGWLDERHVASRLVVQSFSADSVRIVHDLRPDLVTAFLGTPTVADLPQYARFTDRINPWHTTISADYVAAVHNLLGAHGKAMEVDTWIVDDPATARKVQEMGVDGIISNAPDVVREAIGGY
ncbi:MULTISPECIES: glycerophosphodiester phosphodiesterase family protein [unclassified Streptomyces]|uniref:glycerophosphodiester phosphodiesterase n=1 Tax=unclassified Streptomyces TaxID=2593676 RepID=UPI002254A4DD|nr:MULTISPECIES: glycerophosphodiester phosphodiesterase family protein [unclassified Streptomyces]MCX4525299.1 glycerophosphodiester phosphodiesterase family protein [Streptomyces sp. NBC_01551]MCX4544226.1 glycerophosphodiester phosphodiesterase family protein [Streptomyces sp. NBC_01565]